ncbi:uncharacterized protein TNCV_2398431 [Trichonephila clavipes]|uniref:Uncharacterized protein n=1 Tax=Trichonephila clavipes TaxID=2585209 RepID=A0A8X6T4S6_TRICX|nr:uncharacterized protein TNCV_2398431 [Trichonephila clavipes]
MLSASIINAQIFLQYGYYNVFPYKRNNQKVRNCSFFPSFDNKLPSSSPTFFEIIMKTYFCILIALCVVLVTVETAEISSRTRNQSDNLITVNIPRDLLDSLLKALLGKEELEVSWSLFWEIEEESRAIFNLLPDFG